MANAPHMHKNNVLSPTLKLYHLVNIGTILIFNVSVTGLYVIAILILHSMDLYCVPSLVFSKSQMSMISRNTKYVK